MNNIIKEDLDIICNSNIIIKEDLDIICNSNIDWKKFKDSTVLITGAYGMLAQYMLYTLMHLNETQGLNIKVRALCRHNDKAKKIFKDLSNNPLFSVLYFGVEKLNQVAFAKNINFDYIIHAASPASVEVFNTNPINVIDANVWGTRNLLELAKEKKVKGFLFLSSGEVCGRVDKPFVEESDYGYLDPTDIRSCYGESKRMGENLCKCYYHQYGIPTICVRPDHTYGPSMDLENDSRVFAEFVSNIVNNKDIVIKSDGSAVRTFTYISDTISGFFRALLHGEYGESYNVSNNEGKMSIGCLADLLVSLFPEKKLKVIKEQRKDANTYLENKYRIQAPLYTGKIEKLGYMAKVSIKDGFYRTIKSFMEDK